MKKIITMSVCLCAGISFAYAQTGASKNPFQNVPCIPVTQLLRIGDSDSQKKGSVSALQLFLVIKGELSSRQAKRGVFDSYTAQILTTYQKKAGITEDGVGEKTIKHIQSLCTVQEDPVSTYQALERVGDQVDALSNIVHTIETDQKQKKALPAAPTLTPYRNVIGFTERYQGTAGGNFKKVADNYGDFFYKTNATTNKTCIGFKLNSQNKVIDAYVKIWGQLLKHKTCSLEAGTWASFEITTPYLKAAEDKTKEGPLTALPKQGMFLLIAIGGTHEIRAFGTVDTNKYQFADNRPLALFSDMLTSYFGINKKYPVATTPKPVKEVFLATKDRLLSSVTHTPGVERVLYVSDATGKHFCAAAAPEKGKSYRTWGCPISSELPKTHVLIMQK